MSTLANKSDKANTMQTTDDLRNTLAHHDAAINTLGGRMTGVETGLRTLQGEVHTGFSGLGSKLDKLDAQPRFDFHRSVSTLATLVFLFGSICAGVIYLASTISRDDQFRDLKVRIERLEWKPLGGGK